MATTYKARLIRGPCAGTTVTLSQAEWDAGETTCKGAVYVFDGVIRPKGTLVHFTFRPGAPPPPPTGVDATAPHSLKAWGDLRKQINQSLPATLRHMDRLHRGSLSRIHRRHRVGG